MPKIIEKTVSENYTLDMAGSMSKIAETCFPNASKVIDRFHVSKSCNL